MTTQQLNQAQLNAQNRALLLQTATRMMKYLQPVSIAPNQTGRVNLLNTGITTNLRVELTFTSSAVATPFFTPTKAGSMFTAKFVDYDTTVRFNLRETDVYIINTFRKGKDGFLSNFDYSPSSGVYENQFVFDLPLAYHKDIDLRGALYTNVSGGTAYLEFTNNSSNTLNFQVIQEFLAPQYIANQLPLPQLDLNTVNEYVYVVSNDNLIASSQKYIDLPQNRQVVSAWAWYFNGTGLESDLFELLVNGNTKLIEYDDLSTILELDRRFIEDITSTYMYSVLKGSYLGSTSGAGFMPLRYFDFTAQPLITANYGAIQFRFTPATVGSGANVNLLYNNLYLKGTVGGIAQ